MNRTINQTIIVLSVFMATVFSTIEICAQNILEKSKQEENVKLFYRAMDALEAKNYSKALQLFEQAYGNGDVWNSPYQIGMMYFEGKGQPSDAKKAFYWIMISAVNGHTEAEYTIGKFYQQGLGIPRNEKEGFNWMLKAASSGDVYAMNDIGLCYRNGVGTPQNDIEAFKWLKLAAEKGDELAPYTMTKMLYIGRGCKKNVTEGDSWMMISTERGVC